jgi:hypothetical protein
MSDNDGAHLMDSLRRERTKSPLRFLPADHLLNTAHHMMHCVLCTSRLTKGQKEPLSIAHAGTPGLPHSK